MADLRSAVIVYDGLPVGSGGAHRLRSRDPRVAWQQMEGFLQACCDVESLKCGLVLLEVTTARDAHGDQVDSARAAAISLFGAPRTAALTSDIRTSAWSFELGQLDAALQLLATHPVADLEFMPAFVVDVAARFRLKDPASGEVLPDQDPALFGGTQGPAWGAPLGESGIHLRLSSHSTCGILLSLPFESVTEDMQALVARLQEYLPFRMSSLHWTRWQLNKAGTGYVSRRVASVL